jgi:hypothetical protein
MFTYMTPILQKGSLQKGARKCEKHKKIRQED